MGISIAHGRRTGAALLATVFCVQSAWALEFEPPEQLMRGTKVYELGYQRVLPSGRATYEYTTNGENSDNWITLIRLQFNKGSKADVGQWFTMISNSLERTRPKPTYDVRTNDSNGIARFVFEPAIESPLYESDVHKSFHLPNCGVLVYQYAVRYSPAADQSDAGKEARLKTILAENLRLSDEIEKEKWAPVCK